ncbi:serine-rich adhesin for platelets [Patella vulgata]|uniref:serine-rich adhesin for platelets n=1 Tax=Patella vulgata TaxID=6465 RepID=UPI0024A7E56F|nr:serine-rich adhesin for platelets [Patella vulgata]
MAEANLATSTPKKSQTLPPNTHLSPVVGSSNGNFFTKIKKIFRFNSKGKYDFASAEFHPKSRKKRDEFDDDFRRGKPALRSSSVRVAHRNSFLDKEEVVLTSEGRVLLKESLLQPALNQEPTSSLSTGVGAELEDVFEEPGYESLDEIRRKVITHEEKINTKSLVQRSQSEKLPPASRDLFLEKHMKNSILNKTSLCVDHVADDSSRDSGLGSPRTDDRTRDRNVNSATSSVFSDTTLSIGDANIDLQKEEGIKPQNRPNSCPWQKPAVDVRNHETRHSSDLSNTKSGETEESLYANSSILIRKRSQYQSDKSVNPKSSDLSLPRDRRSDCDTGNLHQNLTGKCVSENNLSNQKLVISRAFSVNEANNMPPPLPLRQYTKSEAVNMVADISKPTSDCDPATPHQTDHVTDDNFNDTENLKSGFAIYEDIDSTRLSANKLKNDDNEKRDEKPSSSCTVIHSDNPDSHPISQSLQLHKDKLCTTSTELDLMKNDGHLFAESETVPGRQVSNCDVENKTFDVHDFIAKQDFSPLIIEKGASSTSLSKERSVNSRFYGCEFDSNEVENKNSIVQNSCSHVKDNYRHSSSSSPNSTTNLISNINISNQSAETITSKNCNSVRQQSSNVLELRKDLNSKNKQNNEYQCADTSLTDTNLTDTNLTDTSLTDTNLTHTDGRCCNETDTNLIKYNSVEEDSSSGLCDFQDVLPPPPPLDLQEVDEMIAQIRLIGNKNSNKKGSAKNRPVSSSHIEVHKCIPNVTHNQNGAGVSVCEDESSEGKTTAQHTSSKKIQFKEKEVIHMSWSELQLQMRDNQRDSSATCISSGEEADESSSADEEINKVMTESTEIKHKDFLENMRQLRDCGWYWGPLSYEEAEAKLMNKPDGSFLVRDSSNENYILSLSFTCNNIVHHTRIEHHRGVFSFWSQPLSHGKDTIREFIEQAVENSKNGTFHYFLRPSGPGTPPLPIRLVHPISRFFRLQSLQHMCRFLILRWVRRDHIDTLPVPEKVKNYLRENQYYVESLEED